MSKEIFLGLTILQNIFPDFVETEIKRVRDLSYVVGDFDFDTDLSATEKEELKNAGWCWKKNTIWYDGSFYGVKCE